MQGIQVAVLKEESRTRFNCTGNASLTGFLAVIDAIQSAMDADETMCRKVLVDISELDGSIPEMDKFTLGEQVAIRLPRIRIGVLVNSRVPLNRFAENTAVNRGASLRVGHEEGELLEWLDLPVATNPGEILSRRLD